MNTPNKLTLIRIILVPIILLVWLFPYEQFNIYFPYFNISFTGISLLNIIVVVLFVIGSFTDMLDGRIARSKNLVTTFGKFADPIADKLLVNTMFIVMAYKHMIPVLPVIIMLFRDTVVDGCRMMASKNGTVVAAGFLGKLKTVLQMVTIIIIMLNNLPFELISLPMGSILLWFTSFVSAAGGYSYFVKMKPYIFESIWGILIIFRNNNIGGQLWLKQKK